MLSVRCRDISIGPGQNAGYWLARIAVAAGCLSALPLLVFVLAKGFQTQWGLGLLVSTLAVVVAVTTSTHPAKGYVIDLLPGAIRIRQTTRWYRRLQRARTITAESIESGYLATPSQLVLRLQSGRTVTAELASDGAGLVLDHLRLALDRRAVSVPLSGAFDPAAWLEAIILLAAVGVAVALRNSPHPVIGLLLLGAATALASMAAFSRRLRPRVVVGLDGVRVVGTLHSRFVPYQIIESVTRPGGRGGRIILGTSAGNLVLSCIDTQEREIATLVSRIEEGRGMAARARSPSLDLLDRKGRSIDDWHAALSELARAEAGFRGAALCEDDLDEVLADPGAPLERRLGAALALRSRSSEARTRIRVAAATSVERRVRVALEAAAAEEIHDRVIERALGKAKPRRSVAVREPHDNED